MDQNKPENTEGISLPSTGANANVEVTTYNTEENKNANLDFPNGSVNAGSTNFVQQKAPSPIAQSPVIKNFEMPNDTLRKENEERERQITATEEENRTIKKGFFQRIKDFFKGNKKKGL